ncbi:hypothetical protein AN639_05820 [Candidatus Epulonipiscium fishelsonii]|uniref:Uncharacterized protein n=1 Tax=Candidatus Epulonipiscium fishelsonii TaxID=77094 RepID=A0ACC8X8D8_9FIRM|nr:hypothetical protein AN396_11635 [Epulopiscium sp. SCG-B11WGA-EpuloA1]ONI39728.1 hypothetical protein AN639_05820 [Epulopiscium sp. SCG-B05WGA-EpuloA1]
MDFFLKNDKLDLSLLDYRKPKNLQELAKPYLTEEISNVFEKMSIYLEEDERELIPDGPDEYKKKINIKAMQQEMKDINIQSLQQEIKDTKIKVPQKEINEINIQVPQQEINEINIQVPQQAKLEIEKNTRLLDENDNKNLEIKESNINSKKIDNSKNDLELKESLIGRVVTKDIIVKGICVVAKDEVVDWDIIEESDEGGFLIKLLINSEKIPV